VIVNVLLVPIPESSSESSGSPWCFSGEIEDCYRNYFHTNLEFCMDIPTSGCDISPFCNKNKSTLHHYSYFQFYYIAKSVS